MKALPLVLGAALLGSACAKAHYPAPTPASELAEPPRPAASLRAATARVDITPPPGVSTFGHGPLAEVTDGYWTRIYCRVFALQTEPNNRVAVIPCDLPAMSMLLQRSVAARLVDVLPTTRIMMTATHTHAGPGHYFESQGFGGTLSTQVPGFDPAMLAFLADRVAEGVRRAFERLVPAVATFAHYEDGDACDAPPCGMWGLTWNRSLPAHKRTLSSAGPLPPAPAELCDVEKAIDPALHVLRLDEVDPAQGNKRGPIGVLSFFAMHPTVLPNTNRLIGGDTHSIISRAVERKLASEWNAIDEAERRADPALLPHDPLHGVVNTNEGNVSPVWVEGSKTEAIGLGEKVAARIEALLAKKNAPTDKIALDLRYLEADIPGQRLSTEVGKETCKRAELGESFAYGGCDHPGTVDGLPFTSAPFDSACQAPKQTFLGPLMSIVAGGHDAFPEHVPLALLRLGDSIISFVPAEATIATGREIRRAVSAAFPDPRVHTFLAGLANGYILYVANADEFGYIGKGGGCALAPRDNLRQSYEAASTLYGPETSAFLAEKFGLLAHALAGAYVPGVGRAASSTFVTENRPRLATGDGETKIPDLAGYRGAGKLCTEPGTRLICFQWRDGRPGVVPLTDAPWVELVENLGPKGAVQPVHACDVASAGCAASAIVDDRGYDFVTRVREEDPSGGARWSTLFLPTDVEWRQMQNRTLALRVRGPIGQTSVLSQTFSTKEMPPPCDDAARAACGAYNAPVPERPLPSQCRAALSRP